MESPVDTLRDLASRLGAAVASVLAGDDVRGLSDADLRALLEVAGDIGRRSDALVIEATAQVAVRSEIGAIAERFTTRHGARTVAELVQRTTRVSGQAARSFVRAANAVAQPVAITTGQALPAAFPAMRAALADGVVGVDAVAAVASAIDGATRDASHRHAADEELAASARGIGADRGGMATGPLPCADELRAQASVWAMYLDPDGAAPADAAAMRRRGLTFGRARDGVIPLRGELLPDVAGQLQRLCDSILNPKNRTAGPSFRPAPEPGDDDGMGEAPADFRTRAQRQHDALATILTVAARAGELPTIGGAAPTLIVSVTRDDLASGRGMAHVDGIDAPVPLSVARQVACAGGVQRVMCDDRGRVMSISIADRVFSATQRRAILLRDGACIIPGCEVPGAWCEIHHVTEHARGGATTTDNGVLLCWHHHRTLEGSGWAIRMALGIPEVRGPSWWDATGTWRRVTRSPIRLRRQHRLARQ
ncbi:HNH endonuclease signature motif containing protein [Microbacterium sp. cx-59]|uniref:HNH endonuclease signature motif containing protein n=1 Tax=Microbacterium sp. cx-59 TaxID=2891207 RepID=UPI001E57B512|nr:HNH endonuclease signature motif containing protein [Microbacterium sp. cx-59]MCC4908082.1 HNH endonuclease [Microbacterium sp. cx-59]